MNERDPKWEEVEPLQTIPAGQPIRIEWDGHANGVVWEKKVYSEDYVTSGYYPALPMTAMFIDSTWRPPLKLPTDTTWGIIVDNEIRVLAGAWRPAPDNAVHPDTLYDGNKAIYVKNEDVLQFIHLTQDQINMIESAGL